MKEVGIRELHLKSTFIKPYLSFKFYKNLNFHFSLSLSSLFILFLYKWYVYFIVTQIALWVYYTPLHMNIKIVFVPYCEAVFLFLVFIQMKEHATKLHIITIIIQQWKKILSFQEKKDDKRWGKLSEWCSKYIQMNGLFLCGRNSKQKYWRSRTPSSL